MMSSTTTLISRSIGALVAAAALVCAAPAVHALAAPKAVAGKPAAFPPGLKWKKLEEVSLNFQPKYARPVENKESVAIAKQMWAGAYEPYMKQNPDSAMFFLVGQATGEKYKVTTSLINYPLYYTEECEMPANGSNVVDMYSKCKVAIQLEGDGKAISAKFDGFCFLDLPPESKSRREVNQTEFAVDDRTGTVYYRVIQYGRAVPACNRFIKFQ